MTKKTPKEAQLKTAPETAQRTAASPAKTAASTHKRTVHKAEPPKATVSDAKPVKGPAVTTVPVQEEIALVAYRLWEERGGAAGSAEEDWFRAEQIVKVRRAGA